MAKPKRVDPIKQREKRAKIAAAIGGALFLVVAAIEVPPVLKSNSAPPAHASTPAPTTATTAASSASTATAAAPAPAPGELADTDAPPPVQPGELVSFSMFQSKNPFAPQVTTAPDGTTTSTSTATSASASTPATADKQAAGVAATPTTTAPTSTTATGTLPTTTVPAGGATAVVPSASSPTGAPAPTVSISVNGSVSHVATDDTFPDASPVFRLVSFAKGTAEIGIVGGSYAEGGATLTLHLHTPVTLENQTDGKRYTLELDSTP